jgi:hypothetical protein
MVEVRHAINSGDNVTARGNATHYHAIMLCINQRPSCLVPTALLHHKPGATPGQRPRITHTTSQR